MPNATEARAVCSAGSRFEPSHRTPNGSPAVSRQFLPPYQGGIKGGLFAPASSTVSFPFSAFGLPFSAFRFP